MILDTRAERIKLLKSGFTGSEIEKGYVELNDFKIVNTNLLFEGAQS